MLLSSPVRATGTSAQTRRHGRTRLAVVLAACAASWLSTQAAVVPLGAVPQTARAAASGGLEVLEVRPNFFLLAGAGGSIGVQVGEDGAVVVDAGSAASAAAVVDAIKRLTPKPIRYVIDTGPDADHVGGNEVLSKAGEADIRSGRRNPMGAPILAAEGVLRHMSSTSGSTPAYPVAAWPTETFHYARKYMYWNGEAIEVLHQPAAHTDSDVFVFFRRSDVVVAGDVLDTRQFPVIDVERGGSIQGEIAALNRLVDLAVPSLPIVAREAGTVVVPGHGRLCDQYDVIEYRDMVTIIRDRVSELVEAGRSLEQVKAANPAKGYTGRYGNTGGAWTTDRFVEAVYRSLVKEAKP
jgi:cyclase